MADAEVIEELYRTALPRLCGYGFLLTGSEAEGEELVQAAIVKTFSRWRRIGEVHSAEAYVRAAMRTLTIDAARRATRWRRAMQTLVERGGEDVEGEVAGSDDVAAAIRALPPRVRVAVALRYLDDLTVAETASRMGVTEGAVKKYLHVARERLGPWHDELGGDHEHARVTEAEGRRAR
ncbi:RNA polymerase sigma factor [Demequina rhizosphaerae]|uniref:RNA polymerase sigma factor n=1 Tax=Demequina rhizosphaerae TaxID=1638985 RepID=UPI000782CC6D|nr:sigma-70 family RNA polymerase sigma factor [Demequina rhizosphaerae]